MAESSRFFGWRIVTLGVIVNAVGTGLIGLFGFMVTPLIEEFGATASQLGLGMSLAIVSMALASPVLGPILDRGRLRATMLLGVATMLVALLLLSKGSTLWQLAACLMLGSIGIAMFGMLPAKVLIVNWFVRKRGRALALAYAGTSLAGFLMPPITAWLIELTSWRVALAWIATGAAVIATPAIACFAIRRPEDIGEHPDGDVPLSPGETDELLAPPIEIQSILRDPNFWRIGLGDAMAMCVPVAQGVFFVRHLEELSIPRAEIALVMTLIAACSITGKLSVGFLADRMSPRWLAVGTLCIQAVGISAVALGTGVTQMALAAIPLGLGGGGFFPLTSVLQGRCFGRLVIGRVSGLHALLGLPFLLIAAPSTGFAASSTGSFVAPFLTLGGVLMLGAAVLAFVRVPQTEPGRTPEAAASPLAVAD
jgi:MFS family permease